MRPNHSAIQRNIDGFYIRIIGEENLHRREELFRALVKEEDKYGSIEEQISIVREKSVLSLAMMERQRDILNRMIDRKENTEQAVNMLDNFITIHSLLERRLHYLEEQVSGSERGAALPR